MNRRRASYAQRKSGGEITQQTGNLPHRGRHPDRLKPCRATVIGGDLLRDLRLRFADVKTDLGQLICRVGPRNFTLSPSQIRTGYSRIIRLVPPREGCRLPLNFGFLPMPVVRQRLTRSNGDDPPPSLHGHYTRFNATTRQSAPVRRIGTFGLAVRAACAFSLAIAGQVLTFRTRA